MAGSISVDLLPNATAKISLQDAGSPVASYDSHAPGISLYQSGCYFHGQTNCTLACLKPAHAWSSPYAFHDCMAYSTISTLLDTEDLTPYAADIAAQYGILPYSRFDPSVITVAMASCAVQECSNSHPDNPDLCSRYNSTVPSSSDASTYIFFADDMSSEFAQAIYLNSPASANLDIGGIGVYISYLMQLGIVLLVWCYGRLLPDWLRWAAHAISGRHDRHQYAQNLQKALDGTQQRSALTAGLIEFQKAQAYFAITMQGAAWLALAGHGRMFDATTYQQIGMTVSLIGDVAAASTVCLTFGLYMLHTAPKTSWYTSALSAVAFAMCLMTWIWTRMSLPHIQPTDPPEWSNPACGGRVSPAKFCSADTAIRYSTGFEAPIIAVCASVMLLLLLCQGRTKLSQAFVKIKQKMPERTVPLPKLKRQGSPTFLGSVKRIAMHWTAKAQNALHGIRHAVAELLFVFMAMIMLFWLISPVTFTLYFFPRYRSFQAVAWVEDPKWTFGQLIAITIWAPAIFEYIYSAIWGVEEAHEHRYVHPYKLVKDDGGGGHDGRQEGMRTAGRAGTFYRRLNSHSESEFPLVHVHDDVLGRSSLQVV